MSGSLIPELKDKNYPSVYLNGLLIEKHENSIIYKTNYSPVMTMFHQDIGSLNEEQLRDFMIRQGYIYLQGLLDNYRRDAKDLGVTLEP